MQSTSSDELKVDTGKGGEYQVLLTIFKETITILTSAHYCMREMTTISYSIRPSHDQNYILTHRNCQKGCEATTAITKSAFSMPS
jgi:hypothetical protein